MAGYVYKPPAFIAGLVRRKQAQHKNMLIIMATTYAIALLIGAYAVFNQPDTTQVFFSALGNEPEYSSFSHPSGAPPEPRGSTDLNAARVISSTKLLRANPIIVRDGMMSPASIEIVTPSMGDFAWTGESDLMPGVPDGSDLSFASDLYGNGTAAGGDASLPGRAMWEWTERSAQIIIPPRITPAYMKPMTRLRHPRKAAGIDGWVALRFKIGKSGVYDFEILAEDPPGLGFGAAVKSYIDNCYIWPATVGGEVIVTEVQATFLVCLNCEAEVKTRGQLVFHEQKSY